MDRETQRTQHAQPPQRITSLLVKPASSLCNLDCAYCFYLDRTLDPARDLQARVMSAATLDRLMDGYLAYSYPHATFAFQGGEPTLAGLPFFRAVAAAQERYRRDGHTIANSIQTNGVLIDREWCELFRQHDFLVGLSLDGPPSLHDRYRTNKGGAASYARARAALDLMLQEHVPCNVLCVVSDANVSRARELYSFFRDCGVTELQFIPLAEFDADGTPKPYTITAAQYGQFLCELFDCWWPERRDVRVRFFDNVAEALAGWTPGCCTLRHTCDTYAVVESNGDVYPCDFFVDASWKLGNILVDSWSEIARRPRRAAFAAKKSALHAECVTCEYQRICHGGCPKLRHARRARFDDLDWFCGAYKQAFAHAVPALTRELALEI